VHNQNRTILKANLIVILIDMKLDMPSHAFFKKIQKNVWKKIIIFPILNPLQLYN